VISQAGIVTPPGDVNSIGQAILQLEKSPELREKFGRDGIKLVNDIWSQENLLSLLNAELLKLSKS
jgi:glycosyltransferase involved in cell wall biosynthesis